MTEEKIEIEQEVETFTDDLSDEALDREGLRTFGCPASPCITAVAGS